MSSSSISSIPNGDCLTERMIKAGFKTGIIKSATQATEARIDVLRDALQIEEPIEASADLARITSLPSIVENAKRWFWLRELISYYNLEKQPGETRVDFPALMVAHQKYLNGYTGQQRHALNVNEAFALINRGGLQ